MVHLDGAREHRFHGQYHNRGGRYHNGGYWRQVYRLHSEYVMNSRENFIRRRDNVGTRARPVLCGALFSAAMASPHDFSKWTCRDLTNYLQSRDIRCSKLKKDRLVDLATKVQDLDLALVEGSDETTCLDDFFRVTINTHSGSPVECELNKESHYIPDLRNLPQFSFGDIFAYCLDVCDWSSSRLKSYKNDDGFRLFRSNHIDKVQLSQVSKSMLILNLYLKCVHNSFQVADDVHKAPLPLTITLVKAACIPETRQSNAPYTPEVMLDDTGIVLKGRCTCPA